MMADRPIADRLVKASAVIWRGPAHFWGFVESVGNGDFVRIYDGVNNGGQNRFTLLISAGLSEAIMFNRPLVFRHGIYVEMGPVAAEITLLFEPIRDDPPRRDE